MQEVQHQDIVRQSLQHVGISLREALSATGEPGAPDASPGESLAFVAAVAELSAALVDDVMYKLDASAASFGEDMAAVRDIVSACERERSDFLVHASGSFKAVDSASFTEGSARYIRAQALGDRRRAQALGPGEGARRQLQGPSRASSPASRPSW